MFGGVRPAQRPAQGVPRGQCDVQNPDQWKKRKHDEVSKHNVSTEGAQATLVSPISSQPVLDG